MTGWTWTLGVFFVTVFATDVGAAAGGGVGAAAGGGERLTVGVTVGVDASDNVGLMVKKSRNPTIGTPVVLVIDPAGTEMSTVPEELKPFERLNFTVWESIHEKLVASAGPTELTPVPERIRSVAFTDAGFTFWEKSTVIELGAL
jgi:hypothetical protein